MVATTAVNSPCPSGKCRLSEVGWIPEEWHTSRVVDLCTNIIDYRGRTPRKLGMEWGGGSIPALSAANVKNGYIDLDQETYFGSEELYDRWMTGGAARQGDIVVTTEAPLGNAAMIPDNQKYILSQRTILLQLDGNKAFSPFYLQVILSQRFQTLLAQNATGSTASGIQRRRFETLWVAVPPLLEQRAIAGALSDVDSLLETLDALIAKKRAIKQAAMWQLLTGKTRLAGFAGAWESTELGEIADIISGATPSTQVPSYWNGRIAWCTPSDITGNPGKYLTNTERSITEEGLAGCATTLLPVGALLLCSRATIGEVKIAAIPVCTNQGFKSLVCRSGVSNEFLYYELLSLKSQMVERAIGSTFLEIGKRDVAALKLELPGLEEQTAVATVLADMDAEIIAVEHQRAKWSAIKQAMMEQLLIGRTRLVSRSSEPG